MNDVLDEACRTLAIPKRITTLIRDIWQLQLRMSRRQGKRARKLMEHPKFRAAYDLLELRAGAENNHELQRLTKWWGEFSRRAAGAKRYAQRPRGRSGAAPSSPSSAQARAAPGVAHDSGLYRSWQQPCFSTGAGAGGYPRPGRNSAQPRGRRLFVLPHAAAGPAGSAGLSQRRRCAGNRPAPETLLDHTQRIELQQGRVRKAERWGPRTLDLDIMLFGDAVINSERLTVPHYDMKNRGFMLWPCSRSPRTFTFLTARRCAPCWIISARKSPPAGNPLFLF